MGMNSLEDYEKVCFSCSLPADMCGERNTRCEFNLLTEHKKSLRYKQPFRQDFCGVPIVDSMSKSESREIAELAKSSINKIGKGKRWMKNFR